MSHRALRLRSRPVGTIADTDLELVTEPKPVPGEGQVLVRNQYVSIDPTHRIWMSDRPQYMPPVGLGEVMRAATVGVVEAVGANAPAEYAVGTAVVGFGGVAEYYVGIPGVNLFYPAGQNNLPVTADLSVCSIIIGLTAWHGVNKILNPKEGDIVVVSGAAGAVGSLAGQLAKLKGATVIGIAGAESKCAWIRDELGFDHAINYKTQDVEAELKKIAPDGITHYFDNVGGRVTDAIYANGRNGTKIAFCGAISEYDDVWVGQKNFNMLLMRRMTVQGFICTDHMDEFPEAKTELTTLVNAGKLKYSEDIREGIENYTETVRLLGSGGNTGKLILKI